MLASTAPISASPDNTVRYRLNRAGDRQLNRALQTVTLTRLQREERTRAYADRRRAAPRRAAPKARPTARSSAASSATSPGRSTAASNRHRQRLDAA